MFSSFVGGFGRLRCAPQNRKRTWWQRDRNNARSAKRSLVRGLENSCEWLESRTLLATLAIGDVAFTGYQSTAPDKVSFVLLKQVDSGTVLTVSDNAWNGSALTTNEGTSTLTFGATFSAGTQLNYDATRVAGAKWAAGSVTVGLSDVTTGGFALNASGDNLFAYNGNVAPSSNTDANWVAALASNTFVASGGTTSASLTQLPSAFTLGDTAFSLGLANGAANQNGAMITPATVSGTPAQIRATIYTNANWQTFTTAGAQAIPPVIAFNVTTGSTNTSTTLRMVSYNITASGNAPRTGLSTVLQAIGSEVVAGSARPIDLLFLQEVVASSTTAVATLMNNTYSTVAYATGALVGASTGAGTQGVVYNSQTVTLVGEALVGTANTSGQPRQTVRHQFRPIGTSGTSDFYVYNGHWKSANDSASEARRLVEAQAIRADADALGQGAHILYVGDFNTYTSSDDGFQALLSAGNGQAFDPLNRLGNWSNTSSFRGVFTQAPANAPPNGLTGGGLDDRFDFQIVSGEFLDGSGLEYKAGTYRAFGNNGSVALNGNINDASSTALAGLANRTTVLDLLTTVTDHLPVVADFTVPIVVATPAQTILYGNSTFEVNGVSAAIDTNKSLLQAGSVPSATTDANVTGYSRGLNGVVIDIAGLTSSSLTAADFSFRVAPAGAAGVVDPSTWAAAPAPSLIAATPKSLANPGRIQLKWADNAVQNTWLQIIVLANARTSLTTPAVYYVGSAVGDVTGQVDGLYRTSVADLILVYQGVSATPVAVTDNRDVDKNGVINAADLTFLQNRIATTVLLRTIFVPAANSTATGIPSSNRRAPIVRLPKVLPEPVAPLVVPWAPGTSELSPAARMAVNVRPSTSSTRVSQLNTDRAQWSRGVDAYFSDLLFNP